MYERILLPLDGSEVSASALPTARNLALTCNAGLHLLQVLSPSDDLNLMRGAEFGTFSAEYSQSLLDALDEAQETGATEYLSGVAAGLESDGVSVTTALEKGPVAEKIVEYAEAQQVDVIVMSTHGRGGVRRFLVGSVTDRVIRSTGLPVLVVHPA